MLPKPLCIYHANCADGFAAAWVVRKYFGEECPVDFHAALYGETPPDCTGRQVIIVDFSYKRDVLLQLAEQAASILILDHHESAEQDLIDLPPHVKTKFDMKRSGAMIAWDHFFPGQGAPLLLDYIQDRDLWQFKLPSTREVTAALFSYPYNFATWDGMMMHGIPHFISEGIALQRKQAADVAALIDATERRVTIAGYYVPAANVPWFFASDVASQLAIGHPFAATYYDSREGRVFSLRSTEHGLNVSEIAARFGGGGHRHAAGFRLNREEAIDLEIEWSTSQ